MSRTHTWRQIQLFEAAKSVLVAPMDGDLTRNEALQLPAGQVERQFHAEVAQYQSDTGLKQDTDFRHWLAEAKRSCWGENLDLLASTAGATGV